MSAFTPLETESDALDLLHDGRRLGALLRRSLERRNWLDAYLSACALFQLVEDRLHPDPLQLRRAADFLAGSRSPATRAAAQVVSSAAALGGLRRVRPATQVLTRARDALESLTVTLAGMVLAADTGVVDPAPLGEPVAALVPVMPLIGDRIARLPACFRDFDQHPLDMRWLADEWIRTNELGTDRPICVVGIRTSGCYLAPLVVARLTQRGCRAVGLLTHRRTRPFSGGELARLRRYARAGGLAVVVDDPPGSGRAFASTADAVSRAGFRDQDIALLVSQFAGDGAVPRALRRWPCIVQNARQWAIYERFRPEAVAKDLASLLSPGWQVIECGQPVVVPGGRRNHARAAFSTTLLDPRGNRVNRTVVAQGTGQGYLGRHPVAVASRLGRAVPRVYGFVDGLLYRDAPGAPPGARDVDPRPAIADYVSARARLLPAERDPTPGMRGRNPVWEVAALRLSGMFGRLGPAARLLILEPVTRLLLQPATPSIADGATHWQHWVTDPDRPGRLDKDCFDSRIFSNHDLACYDAVYDLAGAAADGPEVFADELRSRFSELTGQPVDPERWWLYQLVQAWGMGRAGELDAAAVRRRSAGAINGYLAEVFPPRGAEPTGQGALCGIDLDGVLETGPMGMPVTTPAGILTLRALAAHGFSPVLVTGRSLEDVQDRCRTFALRGAVAEYGSVIFQTSGERVVDLRTPAQREAIEAARRQIRYPGIDLDPAYRHCIRVRYQGGPLPPELIDELPVLSEPGFRVIHGQGQTDIVSVGIDKSTGLLALIDELDAPTVAMVVGDSVEDLPAMSLAERAVAPRNADAAARNADIRRTRRAYQAGLAEAGATLLGHHPGGCAVCSYPACSPRTRLMLSVLSLQENGLRGLPIRTLGLASLLVRDRFGPAPHD